MSSRTPAPAHQGDPRHPEHDEFLLALGHAIYESQRLANAVMNVLRAHYGCDFFDLTAPSFGGLISRLRKRITDQPAAIPGIAEWLPELERLRDARNDLVHAFPVLHGLHRRTKTRDVVNFYDAHDLDQLAAALRSSAAVGNRYLYHDGGKAVRALSGGNDAKLSPRKRE